MAAARVVGTARNAIFSAFLSVFRFPAEPSSDGNDTQTFNAERNEFNAVSMSFRGYFHQQISLCSIGNS